MTIRKTKSGKWTVDVSNGFHPVTQKRIRIIRKGLKSKKEALELEQHIRVVELKEKQFDFVVTTDMLFDLLEEDDLKNGRKVSYTSTQRNNYERHIKPYFKNTNLNKLTYDHIFEFREYLKTKTKKQNEKETREKIAPRHVYRALPVLILSSVLLILAVYFISPYSKLKNIEVTGNKQLSKTEVLEASSIQKEDYTLTTYLSQKAHAKNIKQSNLWAEKAEITYRFPITFKIKVTEYKVVAYDYSGEQYFPVLSSGEEIANPVTKSQLPKSYIRLDFSDKAMLKKFVRQLAGISDTIKSEIQTVQHTPSKATEDLLTLMMTDGNKIIVPLSEVAKKLPYYEKIKPQLTEASIVDMEAGIFSYRIS